MPFFRTIAKIDFGSVVMISYCVGLLTSSQHKRFRFCLSTLLLLSFLQTVVLSALGVWLLAARTIDLGAPYIEADLANTESKQAIVQMLLSAIGLGAVLLLPDLFFSRYWPPQE